MTKTDPEIFIQKLKSLQLSDASHAAMRESLAAYADLHEMPNRKAIVSPFSPYFIYRFGFAGALVVLLLVGGVGVTYAANDSLPGQPFYQVKVHVNEPVAEAFIPTVAGKAQYENVLAERRLTEATTLAAQSKLTDQTRTYLEDQATLHVNKSQQDSTDLAEKGDTDQALAIRSDLEARLSAHADLLAAVSPRLVAAGDMQANSQVLALIQKVQLERMGVTQSRIDTEMALAGATTSATVLASEQPETIALAQPASASASQKVSPSAAALLQSDGQARVTETRALFAKHAAALFSLIRATTTAATSTTVTATTTVTSTTTETVSVPGDVNEDSHTEMQTTETVTK